MANKHPVRGVLAGIAGGLVAAWVMNEWTAGPGNALTQRLESPEDQQQVKNLSDGEDATMKTADALTSLTTGGKHLTHEDRAEGGPIVHYSYGALMGGLYGALAEYSPLVRSGLGTTYATALFVGGDLVAVPLLGFSKPVSDYPPASSAGPLTAHLVYGITTDLVRRLVRLVL